MITTGPQVGDTVLTPSGPEEILKVNQETDRVITRLGSAYNFADIVMTDPPRGGALDDIEAWLDGNAYILVTSLNLTCACLCNNCDMLVTTRGVEVTRTHQKWNDTCQCPTRSLVSSTAISASANMTLGSPCPCVKYVAVAR